MEPAISVQLASFGFPGGSHLIFQACKQAFLSRLSDPQPFAPVTCTARRGWGVRLTLTPPTLKFTENKRKIDQIPSI